MACGALLAGSLGGCGQSEKDKYIDAYSPLNTRLIKVNDDLARTINGSQKKSNARLAGDFTPLGRKLGTLSRQIGALDTPADLEQESKALTGTLDTAREDVDGVVAAARRNDAQALSKAGIRLPDEANKISSTANRLARATGARVGG
ncbi:MAG: hypothetical protein ACR2J6_01800 [Thermoleophilaceae bacterium]